VATVADAPTFTDLVDFLSDREGRQVYVEIGTRDQGSRERHTDEFIAMIHGRRRTHRRRISELTPRSRAGGEGVYFLARKYQPGVIEGGQVLYLAETGKRSKRLLAGCLSPSTGI
jgi:hypothetical protein